MAIYILVAGSWHGSWCWSQVVPLLERAGHRVLTPDLYDVIAGEHSVAEQPLQAWADQIAAITAAQNEPVVLVGHSRAGLIISEVAERIPHKIESLVYLCAFLLKDGQTLNDIVQQSSNAKAFSKALIFGDDETCTVSRQGVKRFFYNETPEPLVQFACERLIPETTKIWSAPIHVTGPRFGSVRRAYITCAKDQAIPLAQQQAMQRATPVSHTVTLESDHSPFFSQPSELVAALEHVRQAV
ncbi:alpha/beta fold hydrolase [Methylobacterium sp. PvR107]|uniref:alpha/beta fold hydrolase n=1 Tax=Methylobacterium sp. PvR107 TaxID=2806597 RepID=UPI001AE10FF5|nr:alpha/beta fold hydrolase [Methylobacterium sp. PvR107]MBP1183045.1 pimeloyl-ACP methyl ester carboxylesterase [Methylobacterium sp. PvR107]